MKISIVLLMLGLFSFGVFAEQDDGEIEKIRVTGSRIKRIDIEGPSPITVIDQEQLDISGFSSVGDVLRETSNTPFGVSKKYALDDNGGSARTSLRGLPVGYTINLINGRVTTIDDLDMIPKSALERVEILSDGASAIYGSSALGGVINFITKTDLVGWQVDAGVSLPEPKGGSEFYASTLKGWSQAGHSGLVSVSYRRANPVYFKDRSYSKLSMDENYPGWSPYGSPGSYKLKGVDLPWQAMPNCETIHPKTGKCVFDYIKYMQHKPLSDFLGMFTNTDFDMGGDMEVSLETLFAYQRVKGILAPAPDRLESNDITDKIAQNWGQPGLEEIKYRLVDEKGSGTRIQSDNKFLGNVYLGLDSYLNDSWNLQAGLNLSGSAQLGKNSNYANKLVLLKLAEEGQWNPFNKVKDDISSAIYQPSSKELGFEVLSEVIADGEVSLPFGVIDMAVGGRALLNGLYSSADEISWNKEEQKSHQWGGGSLILVNGKRYSLGSFLELSFPLLDVLEFQTAGSVDYYQYSGLTSNPKLAVKWAPFDFISTRGSWTTGFKAPDIEYLFLDKTLTHPFGRDFVTCEEENKDDCTAQYAVEVNENKNLKPQRSNSYNLGIVLQPSNNVSFSMDYFKTEITKMIRTLEIDEITQMEVNGKEDRLKSKFATTAERDDSGLIRQIATQPVNAGSYQSSGFEFKFEGAVPLPNDEYTAYLKIEQVLMTNIQERSFDDDPDYPYVDRLGHWGYPSFKNKSSLGVKSKNSLLLEVSARITSSYNQSSALPGQSECGDCGSVPVNFKIKPFKIGKKEFNLSSHVEWDSTLSLPVHLFFDENTKGKLILKVENIFNSKPPENREKGGWSQSNIAGVTGVGYTIPGFYSTDGRVWKLSYSQNF